MRHWAITILLCTGCTFGGDSITEEQFCKEYAHRECEKVAGFCSFPAASCEPSREAACREWAGRSKSGTRQFTAANVNRCLDQVSSTFSSSTVTPTQLAALDDACGRVFQGIARARETCSVNFDCVGKLVCDKGLCGTPTTVSSGGGCANIGESCPKGEYCSMATGLFFCTPKQKVGMPCSTAQPCTEGLRCRDGTCDVQLAAGENCLRDDDCQTGYCNPYVLPATPQKCTPGLGFAYQSPSCIAYMTSGPSRGQMVDSGTSD
jgi:hypothetical protein